MDVLNPFKTSGWKKAARVNCTILVILSAIRIGLSSTALSQGFKTALFFYSGSCSSHHVSTINTSLHLLINVVSTLVVWSWLDVGVSSIRNTFRLARFKSLCWTTDYRGAQFHLTIASENFIEGGTYFPPGASLLFPGFDTVDTWNISYGPGYDGNGVSEDWSSHYGFLVAESDYSDEDSLVLRNISTTAKNAHQWTRLDSDTCKQAYTSCQGLSEYDNVVLVVNKPGGWVRDDMWKLQANESRFWDRYIPADQPNHLFFDAQCSVRFSGSGNIRPNNCWNSCMGALGTPSNSGYYVANEDWANYSFYSLSPGLGESYEWRALIHHAASDLRSSGLDISIDYCLAKPLEATCQVGVAPILLLVVTIFVVIKTCTAILVATSIGSARETPLVTPGDAIASFITSPDTATVGYCTMSHRQTQQAFKSKSSRAPSEPQPWQGARKRWASAISKTQWAISYLFITIGLGVCIGLFAMVEQTLNCISRAGFFPGNNSPIIQLDLTLISAVLIANSPQLLLTLCYFTYNNIFTHLHSAREWAQYGYGFFPLRVTDPKQGHQLSTYRLQLPYRYSLSLMVVSIFLHWVLANTIYVLISTGGYNENGNYGYRTTPNDPSLPADAATLVGYSPGALLTLMLVSIILALIPPIWSLLVRLPPNIVIPGCNPLALSAACHVSDTSCVAMKLTDEYEGLASPEPSAFSLQRLGKHSLGRNNAKYELLAEDAQDFSLDDGDFEKNGDTHLEKIAQSKLRWGVVRMPQEWFSKYGYDAASVGHLGFDTREDGVAPPLWGHLYA
ncbi:hypothetical protein F5Y08DRAFT_332352 [Xylaria arbuscula]|nr:hypothetical protein F5Y08DRAFT_332352 [Xylaria arbuscula]